MEYVDSQVILSTIHGAKGLEWDYVFIIDLEIWGMPGLPKRFNNNEMLMK